MENIFNKKQNQYDSVIFCNGINCYIIIHNVEHHSTGRILHSYISRHIPEFKDVVEYLHIKEQDINLVKDMINTYYTV